MSIFLIGYRGSGKTSVAQLLADKLGWKWCDADILLESRFATSIRQIFAAEGEAGFRQKEAAVLEELTRLENHVIATGGGIVVAPENRLKLKAGKVVWLAAAPEVLHARMRADVTSLERRPDLAQGGRAEVEELLRQRSPLYSECADQTVDTTDKSPEDVADEIYRWLMGNG